MGYSQGDGGFVGAERERRCKKIVVSSTPKIFVVTEEYSSTV